MRRLVVIPLLLLVLIFSGCSQNSSANTLEPVNQQAEQTVKKFIEIAYFDKGTYKDFVSLYAKGAKVNTEKEFNHFRKTTKPKNVFPKDYDTVQSIEKHLKQEKTDENNVNVYWVENPDTDGKEKARMVWTVTKVNGKWLIK